MDLVMPDWGLVVWTFVTFILLLVLLRAFAWKPIMGAIIARETSIEKALSQAEAAKEEMARLISENEQLLKQARAERDQILREARQMKDQIITEAKDAAHTEGNKMLERARLEIENQKAIAMADVKNQVATLSIDIAEKILRKQFEDQHAQDLLVADLLKEVKLK